VIAANHVVNLAKDLVLFASFNEIFTATLICQLEQ